MSRASDRLREFHEAFDVPMGDPTPRELAERRRTLHREEHAEVNDALHALAVDLLDEAERRKRLEALARELADEMVVAYGTAEVLGIDLDAAFDAVMDSNMSKMPGCDDPLHVEKGLLCPCGGTGKGAPLKRDDGKILKGPNFVAPDMSGAIR